MNTPSSHGFANQSPKKVILENNNTILWEASMSQLQKKYGDDTFKSWFSHLKMINKQTDKIVISVPTLFIKRWIEDNYLEEISSTCKIFFSSIEGIELVVERITPNLNETKNQNINLDEQKDCNNDKINNTASQWNEILTQIKDKLLIANGENCFQDLLFVKTENDKLTLSVKNNNAKAVILDRYIKELTVICKKFYSGINSVCIIVSTNGNNNHSNFNIVSNNQEIFWSPIDKRFTFENFVVGKPNELAFTAAKRVAESEFPVMGSNPLFLYGGVGLGKTHLMHAIAWYIIQNTQRKVVYLSAEKFMHSYVSALRNKNIMFFKNAFRSVDVLMVDDVQFISGKDSTQEEFFHTFNALIDNNKQLVISADRSPSDLDGVEERIRSRLGWGLVADINDSTFELRLGILQSKVEVLDVSIDQKVLEFLAQNIKSNIRELEGALNKVVINASLHNADITIEFVRETLEALLRSYSKVISIEEIKKRVVEFFGIRASDMSSDRRTRNLARPRQIAMYLCKFLTNASLQEIGRAFSRDHATVIHSTKQVEKIMATDIRFTEDVQSLINLLK